MSKLREIRDLLFTQKKEAAGQRKKFLPKESLDQILHRDNISESLGDASFHIQQHKFENTIDLVLNEGKRVFAILVETKLEFALVDLVEHRILDRALPVSEEQLKPILAESTDRQQFAERQWAYMAYDFPRIQYVQRLSVDYVLPYVEQTEIEGGGFSRVYKVLVHPTHQSIENESQVRSSGPYLFRKEITRVNSKFNPKDELELLFLLKHPSIVELRAAYVHGGIYNLLFPLAIMDLDKFLLHKNRIAGFEEDRVILKAIHGLSCGLRYLHNFETSQYSLHGVHQDIKPKNVLIRGMDFILADFGLSRLKPVEESSQTTWNDATFEYGAPECRDETTWTQGHIGRASDIWSLSCIISELMICICKGPKGVQEFRADRLMQVRYGKQDAFHDGRHLKEQVFNALAEVEREANSLAISAVFELLKAMFAEQPKDRPSAKEVESRLECIVVQALIQNMLDAITELQEKDATKYFQVKVQLEGNRFQAWAGALGLISLRRHSIHTAPRNLASFPILYETLKREVQSIESFRLSKLNGQNSNLGLDAVHRCNEAIYDCLTDTMRASADRLFPILFIRDSSPSSLSSVGKIMVQELPGYQNTCRIAAIRGYMSSFDSQISKDFDRTLKLDQRLIEKDILPDDFQAHPEIYSYNAGYPQDQRKKVLVEWRDYEKKLDDDIEDEKLQRQLKTMFQRIPGLVAMLRRPKPSSFRDLDCLGYFHDPEKTRFGIVYGFPDNHSTPVRLHYLLKGGGSKGLRPPHIGQKFLLAKTLATCLQDVHLSGWVHKDINSYNILFFRSVGQLGEEDYRRPSLIGFQYSREDEQDAYTSGPDLSDKTSQYRHPRYREGSSSFKREFDYYSLGLVFLEIGLWECLSNVDKSRLMSPSKLKDECIRICGRQVLERMGPIYKGVVMTCLGTDSQLNGAEEDVAIDFQRDVIERLDSCRV